MKREERVGIFAGLIVIVAVVIVISTMVWFGNFGNDQATSPKAPSSSLIPAGTTIAVNTSSYQYYSFQTSYAETFTGTFSSNVPVSMYLLTPSEFANVQSHSSYVPTNYIKYLAPSTGYNFSWTIQSGSYVILFMNANSNSVANVMVVNAFQLSNYYV